MMASKRNRQIFNVSSRAFRAIVRGRQRYVRVDIPTALLCIDRLPGEGRSAWTVEDCLKGGKAYRKCTRLEPFDGHHAFRVRSGTAMSDFLAVEGFSVRRRAGKWVWDVAFRRAA